MLVAGSRWESVEPVTETDDGMLESVSWKWQWPEGGGMLSSSARLAFTFSKGGAGGNGCLVGYDFSFVFTFYMQSLWLHIGVACAVSEIGGKIPIDLMGTSQAFQTVRSSWTDENKWLFDKMVFLVSSHTSLYVSEKQYNTSVNKFLFIFVKYITNQIMKFAKLGTNQLFSQFT